MGKVILELVLLGVVGVVGARKWEITFNGTVPQPVVIEIMHWRDLFQNGTSPLNIHGLLECEDEGGGGGRGSDGRFGGCRRLDDGFRGDWFDCDDDGDGNVIVKGYGLVGFGFGIRKVVEAWDIGKEEVCGAAEAARGESGMQRAVSEEGQLWDFPDIGYYSESTPFVNISRVNSECQELKKSYGPSSLSYGYNTLILLVHDVEDFVTYKYLSREVWDSSSTHVARVEPLTNAIQSCLSSIQSSYGLRILLQPYELGYPDQLCHGENSYNCSVWNPDLETVLNARYKELFERIPALDGIIATITDSWSPRAGYEFYQLWESSTDMARAGAVLYNAVTATDRSFTLRLWSLGKSIDWDTFESNTPKDLALALKVTAGDYVLNEPINPFLENSTILHSRPFQVLVDAFREYNGWGSALCYMTQWEQRLKTGFANGLQSINVWGAWAPGCTWPTSNANDELYNVSSPDEKVSWAGPWNSFRVFGSTIPKPTNPNPQAVAAQANARLALDLSRNPSTTTARSVAMSLCTEWLGQRAAQPCADGLMVSAAVWEPLIAPANPFATMWTVLLNADTSAWNAISSLNPSQLDAVATSASEAADLMAANLTEALYLTNNTAMATDLLLAANRTSRLVGSIVCLQDLVLVATAIKNRKSSLPYVQGCDLFRPHILGEKYREQRSRPIRRLDAPYPPCEQLQQLNQTLGYVYDTWALEEPLLGTQWQVHQPEPAMYARPSFWRDAKQGSTYPHSHREWAEEFSTALSLCL